MAVVAPFRRIIVFVGDVDRCAEFYSRVFGFQLLENGDDPGVWRELDTGEARLAFHKAHGPDGPVDGPTGSPHNPHKIVFYSEDVEGTRETLIARGAEMGPVQIFGDLHLCDGADPEGHPFQVSNR